MPNKFQKIDAYNDSEGPSISHERSPHNYGHDPRKVKIRTMASEHHTSDLKHYGRRGDPLYAALSAGHKINLPADNEHYHHTSQVSPRGAHYNPAGPFGRTQPTTVGSTHQLYGANRHSAPSANAVPGHQNTRHGDNAVPGHQNSREGQNAVPGHQNTNRGQNGVSGNQTESYGENALAARFRPKFGKPHGNRV